MRKIVSCSSLTRALCLWLAIALLAHIRMVAQQQQFRQYGPAEGLSNLNVRCLLQDEIGFLWIGTDNGLFRFDGAGFREYDHQDGLPSTEINALGESPTTGQLWAATPAGLVHFDAGKFVPLQLNQSASPASLRQIAFDRSGAMYLIGASGILKAVSDSAGRYSLQLLIPGDVHGMLVDGDALYFGRGAELWRMQGERIEEIGSEAELPKDSWSAIARDSLGNLWVRSTTRLFELPSGHVRFVDRSAHIPHAVEPQLSVDRRGRAYVSTMAGAVVFEGQSVSFLDVKHGLPAETVSPILLDRDDSLWLGMMGSGLVHRLGHGEWTSWKRENGLLHNSVWAIHRDGEGKIWVGTSGGLNLLNADGTPRRSWATHTGLPADRVLAIHQAPSGDIFVGTDPHGLSQFNSSGKLIRTYGEKDGFYRRITAMSVDRQGCLWVVTDGGIYRSEPAGRAGAPLGFTHFDAPELKGEMRFRDIVVTEAGVVWVATSRGLRRYASGQWRAFTTADGLVADDLDAIAMRNGALWVAYRDALGLTRFEIDGDRLKGHGVTSKDGLSSDAVYALKFDGQGRLWANTDKGVNVLTGGSWQHFSSEDGLVWDDTNSGALEFDEAGNVWIGTSGGMSRYTPPAYASSLHAPTLVLTKIQTGSREWQPGNKAVVPYSERRLEFQFAAVGASGERARFRYRLQGYEDGWIDTAERTVQFAALPPGKYAFEVSAVGPYGDWKATPISFVFTIEAPWWQRWYFAGACLLAMFLIGRMVWRLRVRSLITQKARLQHVVEAQTAELREQHRQLEAIAYLDQLTSLPNRRMFTQTLRARVEVAIRAGKGFALLLIDLDQFKDVNDNYGHDAGDTVLAITGARMRAAIRANDVVARIGGDEFAILLEDPIETGTVESVCTRIIRDCGSPIPFQEHSLHIKCSIGIAVFPNDAADGEQLCKAADMALYEVKRNSRNDFCWFSNGGVASMQTWRI